MELTIVIPVYREASHLEASIQAITQTVAELELSYEILLIDDGSPDDSWQVIRRLFSRHHHVRGIRFSRNFGKEAAIYAGLERARGDAAIVMDSDLQHPPALIPEMVRLWREEGYDVVSAVKVDRGDESFIYKMFAKTFNRLMWTLAGIPASGASDFKLLNRRVVDAFISMSENQSFYRGMVEWLGFRHTRIPMVVSERSSGSSSWSISALHKLAITAIISFSSLPLHIVTILGLLYLVFGVLLGTNTLIQWISGKAIDGFTTVILLQLITGSILMICLGIIGEYLAAVFKEIKKRPKYLIMDSLEEDVAMDHGKKQVL